MNTRLFNEELINKTKEERVKFFKNFTVSHPLMKETLKELLEEIYGGSQNIIMVVGPSGVGKSRLFYATLRSVINDMAEELKKDESIIPITGLELPNPDLGKFNWKDFYDRVLTSLKEPLIEYKIDTDMLNTKKSQKVYRRTVTTAAALRRSVENAFYHRKCKAILIDEAQHFFSLNERRFGNSEINQRQFNSIKSLANMSKVKIVLFGTYDLNAVFNLDGQLSRRVKEIHFPRYRFEIEEDQDNFYSIVSTFQVLLPLKKEPKLTDYFEYLYESCIGCTGILKDWLQRCLIEAIDNNEETITLKNLKKNALQTKKLITLANEAIDGEYAFKYNAGESAELKDILGIEKSKPTSKPKGNPSPGKRKPHRDRIGEIK